MKTERRIVDDRVFLLGLDELYRERMKTHERGELLVCARETARVLSVAPADVPIEGYYFEDELLSEYFCLVRALQQVFKLREPEVISVDGYLRLKQVTEAPIFGPPGDGEYLLSGGEDALSVALTKTFPAWNVENLTNTTYQCALDSDDFSLVALAALSRDSVVLTALRESVVLYAPAIAGAAFLPDPEYLWQVDPVVESRAQQFVAAFNELFDDSLPHPSVENAAVYWNACDEWKTFGRCVRIGYDNSVQPIRHYHWGIDRDEDYQLFVRDFWDDELWTTQRFRDQLESRA